MRLLNLEFEDRVEGITLTSSHGAWDLHNCATFEGLIFDPSMALVILKWRPSHVEWHGRRKGAAEPGPMAPPSSFSLEFKGVRSVSITAGDESDAPSYNETTVHGFTFVEPGERPARLRMTTAYAPERHLLVALASGRDIEIDADTCELVMGPS